MPLEAFLALCARTSQDRDFAPGNEESSRQAGARLQAFLAGLPGTPGPVAAVTHGGITTDLLCNLLGDDVVPRTCWMRASHRAPSPPLTT
jgi:broad specificity phosphatase PhoE